MGIEEIPVKKRRSNPKTRTGCQTCKIRRVKCDEAKPACERCTKTGRTCDGYKQLIMSTKLDGTQVVKFRQLVPRVAGSSQERRAFHYFVSNTVAELSGFYTSSFWERLILQASSSDAALRHAVVAIGTLHEEFANRRLSYYTKEASGGVAFAVNQYLKAIAQLRKSLSSGNLAPLSALMSCILFVCFDSLRGSFVSAMVHLQSGLKILRDMKGRTIEMDSIIEDDIVPLFMRLNVQAILYIDTRPAPEKRAFVAGFSQILSKDIQMPATFSTMEEARSSLNRAADGIFRMFHLCDANLPMSAQPEEAFHLYHKYSKQLAAWNFAFGNYMKAKSSTLSSKELRGAALMKIHHLTTQIMANIIPCIDDPRKISDVVNDFVIFDRCLEDFKIIVGLAKSLIAAAEEDARNGISGPSHTFSTDLGLVGPLYYTCCRCNDIPTRMTAMELLLRCPRREGMWDSEAGVRMIQEYWGVESRYRVLQQQVAKDLGIHVYLGDVVDLTLDDEMKWTWKWKGPFSGPSTPCLPCLTPPNPVATDWTDVTPTPVGSDVGDDLLITSIGDDFGLSSLDLESMVFW